MNSSKSLFRLAQLVTRATVRNSSSATAPSPKYGRMKNVQTDLGIEDGALVHVKTGLKDNLLFFLSAGLVSVNASIGLYGFLDYVIKEN